MTSLTSSDEGRKISAGFLAKEDCNFVGKIFDEPRRQRIGRHARVLPTVLTSNNMAGLRGEAAQIEALFTCWGFPHQLLTPENFPALRVLFYSGGTIKGFGYPLLERGVQIVTAKAANAVSVAEFCFAQILLSCKGYFRNSRLSRNRGTPTAATSFVGAGVYGEKVALLGMGAVAREVVSRLKNVNLRILTVDPYLTPSEAEKLGVKIVTLEEAFAQAYVISNHLPDLPSLRGVIGARLFSTMRPDATFINTGRGAQVNEEDLVNVARARPDLMALLDVTDPEPPSEGSPLYTTPNIVLSSHIAGALNDEVQRLGDCVIDDFERYATGKPFLYAEKLEQLSRMA